MLRAQSCTPKAHSSKLKAARSTLDAQRSKLKAARRIPIALPRARENATPARSLTIDARVTHANRALD